MRDFLLKYKYYGEYGAFRLMPSLRKEATQENIKQGEFP